MTAVGREVSQRPIEHAVVGQQRLGILLRRAMREELDEHVVADPRRHALPQRDAVARRVTVTGELADFDARHERHAPLAEVDRQRAGNHQQIAGDRPVRRDRDTGVVRLGSRRIVGGPVDRVDDACLRRRRRRRQREVGVAAELCQERDLVGETARATARQRAVERPVAVNETEADAASVAAQQPVSRVETLDEAADAIDERRRAVTLVMKVDLHVGDCPVDETRQELDRDRMVLLFRIEERVARRPPGVVQVTRGDDRPAPHPALHAIERRLLVGAVPPRLEVIRDRDPDARDRRSIAIAQARRAVAGQPGRQRAKDGQSPRIHTPPAAPVVRAVGVHTIDCLPRTNVMNPTSSARFIERK